MRVAVIGAGIIGVTTAYELAVDGHEVTVFERRGSVAAETSFANAGVVAPGYVTPWAAPGMPGKVLRHLFGRARAGAAARGRSTPATARLAVALVARLPAAASTRPTARACIGWRCFSRERLHAADRATAARLRAQRGLPGAAAQRRATWPLAQPGLQAARRARRRAATSLDAAGCRAIEPGLNADTPLHAGIYLPDDEVGNCRQFAHLLRKRGAARSARCSAFNADVAAHRAGTAPQLAHRAGRRTMRATSAARRADAERWPTTQPQPARRASRASTRSSSARRSASRPLLRAARPAAAAARRCTATRSPRRCATTTSTCDVGPRAALMDERYKVAISRLGKRVRVAGSAEIGGSLAAPATTRALATLVQGARRLVPRRGAAAARRSAGRARGRCCPTARRCSAPAAPTACGSTSATARSGWALACGSARAGRRRDGRPQDADRHRRPGRSSGLQR